MTNNRISTGKKSPAPVPETREAGERVGTMPAHPTGGIVPNDTLLVKCNLDTMPMNKKPDKSEYGKMRYRMFPKQVDARQLFAGTLNGYAFTPAALSGTGGNSWTEQRLFAVDIDNHADDENPLTVEQAREIMEAHGVNPLFGYYTFSHCEAVPRFRIAFATDETVTDKADAQRITEALQSLFPDADGAAKDPARVFLGTNKGAAIPYTGLTNPVARLLDLYHERVEPEQTAVSPTRKPVSDSALAQAIEEFDMGGYVSTSEGIQGKWRNGRLAFSRCPICGHKDDFYTMGNVWKCFSASNATGTDGGNIINYLEARHGFTREQAREYFMYDVLKWDRAETRKQTRESERVKRAERTAGAAAITDKDKRPEYILVKKKRDPATGEFVDVETVSCPRLAQTIREQEHFFFVKSALETVNRFWYKGGVYRLICDDELKGHIKERIIAWNPDILKMRDVREVFEDIITDLNFVDESGKDAEELVVNFKNGLYYPMTDELKPHTPDVFLTRQIPLDFPEDFTQSDYMSMMEKAPTFCKFIRRLCYGANDNHPDGGNRENFLMEWMAVILSNIRGGRFKKSLWMVGPGDSGKSKLLELMAYLLGAENCHSTDLEQLEARFGTAPIYNKRMVFSPDQKYIKVKELNLFKKLTGEDAINIERKGKDSFSYFFDGFLWFCMNKLPRFGGDDGKHVYDRMIIFKTPESIPAEEQDKELIDKLKAEAPYIVALILSYLPQVVESGYRICEPKDTEEARKAYAAENDPVRVWLADCCIDSFNPGEHTEEVEAWKQNPKPPAVKKIYAVYKEWCREFENGYCLKYGEWKQKMKEIMGTPDMPDKDFSPHTRKGNVMIRYFLNAETLGGYGYIVNS